MEWGTISLCSEQIVYCIDFFLILDQNVSELLHHLIVDGLSRSNVLEFEKHVKGSLGRSEGLEGFVNEHFGLIFNGDDFTVESVHDTFPLLGVADHKWIKYNLLNRYQIMLLEF